MDLWIIWLVAALLFGVGEMHARGFVLAPLALGALVAAGTAEGQKQAAVLKAEGAREAAILRADGEAKAIATVFNAIHEGDADKKLLSYEYLRMLPELARGDANKVFVIPSEFAQAFADIGGTVAGRADTARANGAKRTLAAAPGPDPGKGAA
jgi:hypothetical protein